MKSKVLSEKFGTFSGVFLPTVLTILGAVLFVRMGWIVGVGGIHKCNGIISLTALIALITALSIASTATNMSIGKGGVYYFLSRTFGLEVSSAITIPLCLAQGLGIAFYLSAFAESVHFVWPQYSIATISFCSLLGLTTIALISTRIVLKTQLLICILVTATLLSLFIAKTPEATDTPVYSYSFWPLFAIFFPAFTGIEVGLSMTQELKKPSLSLMMGTIVAIAISYAIYLAMTLFFATSIPRSTLIDNPLIFLEIASIKPLAMAGIWGATLSGALSNMLSAPRLIDAFATASIIPNWIQKRIAICCIAIVAAIGLLLGGLDNIAPLLTMFFLLSYGMINCATGVEAMIGNPSWRPRFRTPWALSLGGGLLCFLIMLLINTTIALIAFAFAGMIYVLVKRRRLVTGWEDIRHSIFLFLSCNSVYSLATTRVTPKNWRPNLLTFIGDPNKRPHLMTISGALTHKKGFLTFASLTKTSISKAHEGLAQKQKESNFPFLIEARKAPAILEGMKEMISSFGLGPLSPNTFVLGVTHKKAHFPIFAEVIATAYNRKKNIMLIQENAFAEKERRQIDVWWGGQTKRNSALMLVLAHMLQTSVEWRGATVNLKTIITDPNDLEKNLKKLTHFANQSRLKVTPKVVIKQPNDDLFQQTIRESSKDADLILLGLMPPNENYTEYYTSVLERTKGFPTLALVLGGEQIHFNEILSPHE